LIKTNLSQPSRVVSAIGFGATRFVVPNTSPANKALNRRVEIALQRAGG
jgi:flagellar motor protein MotB